MSQAPTNPTPSATTVSTGTISVPAITRGITSLRTGSVPSARRAAMPTAPIAVTAARPNLFGTTVAADAPAKGTAAYVPFYSRTHPGGGRGPSSPSATCESAATK